LINSLPVLGLVSSPIGHSLTLKYLDGPTYIHFGIYPELKGFYTLKHRVWIYLCQGGVIEFDSSQYWENIHKEAM